MNSEQLANTLAQLKDFSEMMIDLAYSALLYGSEEVANHVTDMEELLDITYTEFELEVLGMREEKSAKSLLSLIRLAEAAKGLADAAGMMADIVLRGARAHSIVQDVMEQAGETILVSPISEDSSLDGKRLGDLGLEDDIGMRIIAVKRGRAWTYIPSDFFVLQSGDVIIARGFSEGREKLLTLANPEHIH